LAKKEGTQEQVQLQEDLHIERREVRSRGVKGKYKTCRSGCRTRTRGRTKRVWRGTGTAKKGNSHLKEIREDWTEDERVGCGGDAI